MKKLFLTILCLPVMDNVYLFKNKSLRTLLEIQPLSFDKFYDVFSSCFKIDFQRNTTQDNIKEFFALHKLGNWFFKEAFCFIDTVASIHKIFYISKIDTIFSLINRRLLFLSYMSLLGRAFKISCKFLGVGYRVTSIKNNIIVIKLGRSYRVKYNIPKNIQVRIFGKRRNKLRFYSRNLSKLMTFVFLFRKLRWPDSYKSKGIKITKQKLKVKFREKFGSLHYKSKK